MADMGPLEAGVRAGVLPYAVLGLYVSEPFHSSMDVSLDFIWKHASVGLKSVFPQTPSPECR